MPDIDSWWGEELANNIDIVRKIASVPIIVAYLCRIVLIALGFSVFQKSWQIASFLVSPIVFYFLSKIRVENNALVVIVICVLTEIYNLALWANSKQILESHQPILGMIATFYVAILQCSVLKSRTAVVLSVVKHVIVWDVQNYFFYEVSIEKQSVSMMASLTFVICSCCHVFNLRKKSYQTYLYRKQLERTKHCLDSLVSFFPDGLIVVSQNKEVLLANSFVEEKLQCRANQVIGMLESLEYIPQRQIHFENRSTLPIRDIEEALTFQLDTEMILGVVAYQELFLELRAKRILWKEQSALLLTLRDATLLIKLEQMEAEDRCKTAMLRSVSHELRTPSNAILSYVDEIFAEEGEFLSNRSKENLKVIEISSKSLLSLVNDLLDYSRILAGAFSIYKEPFKVRKVLKECIKIFEIQAKKKGIALILRIDPTLPTKVYTDHKRLTQIILNLVSNALKFTKQGYIEVCATFNSKFLLGISVKDTGIGIPRDRIRQLFKLFSQVHTPEINYGGCGLGLNISSLLVKELGGDQILVDSCLEKGSEFSFSIPILQEIPEYALEDELEQVPEETTEIIRVKQSIQCFAPKKQIVDVLVVDDNDFNREILIAIIKREGITWMQASNGKEAIELVQRMDAQGLGFKVIVMDCNMPVMDGWDATKELHKLYQEGKLNTKQNVIGYTAYNNESDIDECYKSGMVLHLTKPAQPSLILRALRRFI